MNRVSGLPVSPVAQRELPEQLFFVLKGLQYLSQILSGRALGGDRLRPL